MMGSAENLEGVRGVFSQGARAADARPVVGRFAPSPTGRMHLGNVAASLLAWLSVRSQGGKLVRMRTTTVTTRIPIVALILNPCSSATRGRSDGGYGCRGFPLLRGGAFRAVADGPYALGERRGFAFGMAFGSQPGWQARAAHRGSGRPCPQRSVGRVAHGRSALVGFAARVASSCCASRIWTTVPAAVRGPSCSWTICAGWGSIGMRVRITRQSGLTSMKTRCGGSIRLGWYTPVFARGAWAGIPLFLHAGRAPCRECPSCQRRHARVCGDVSESNA